MISRKGILSKTTYTDVNSKRFIKSNPYTVLAQAGKEKAPITLAFENKTSNILIYNQILIFGELAGPPGIEPRTPGFLCNLRLA